MIDTVWEQPSRSYQLVQLASIVIIMVEGFQETNKEKYLDENEKGE